MTDRPTDLPTDRARCRVACPRLKKIYLTLSDLDKIGYGGTAYLPITAPKISSKSDNFYYHFHLAKELNVGLHNCGLKELVKRIH